MTTSRESRTAEDRVVDLMEALEQSITAAKAAAVIARCPNDHGDEGCILCSPCGGGQDTCDETLRYVCSRHSGGQDRGAGAAIRKDVEPDAPGQEVAREDGVATPAPHTPDASAYSGGSST